MDDLTDLGARTERIELERQLAGLVRALSSVSTQIGHDFAVREELPETDLRALMLIYMADIHGAPLATSQLAQALSLTSAGGTYLVERLVASGHVRREPHPTDRRKSLLRYAEPGLAVARDFFEPLFRANHAALQRHDDQELRVTLGVMRDVVASMQGYRDSLRPPR